MKIFTAEDGSDILFAISDYPPEYTEVFENAFYSYENGSYVKRFPIDTPNISKIMKNWEISAKDMFAQMGGFKKVNWEESLLSFIERLKDTGIEWWLTGSCATCVSGVNIKPHDIDIMLNSKDIDKLNQIFADCIVEPIRCTKGWVVANFGVLFMDTRIDLAYDPEDFVDNPYPVDFGPFAMNNLETVIWKSEAIRVPPLELQMQVNKRRGRNERADTIEKFLLNQIKS